MKCNYCNGEYSVGHRCKQMLLCYVQDMSEINRLIEKLLPLGGSKFTIRYYDRLIIYESQKNNNPQRKIS
jgi:hypothetical protein